jgi:Spy/CpxP family protein refolding chaperone
MRKIRKLGYNSVLAATMAVALLSGAAIAKGPGSGKTEHIMAHISEQLELDNAQLEQLESLLNARLEERRKQHQHRQQLRELVNAETLDRSAVEQVAANMTDHAAGSIVDRSVQLHLFQLSLTEEQKEKWLVLEQRRRQRRTP